MVDLERELSTWITGMVNREHRPLFNPGRMTAEALSSIHATSMASVESGILQGAPAAAIVDGAFLAGLQFGFLFREYLAQMEELPL